MDELLFFFVLGATGDWAAREIFPSLFQLFRAGKINSQTKILGLARTVKNAKGQKSTDPEDFRNHVREVLRTRIENCPNENLEEFLTLVDFYGGSFTEVQEWTKEKGISEYTASIAEQLRPEISSQMERKMIFLFSLPPNLVNPCIVAVSHSGLINKEQGSKQVAFIEKPHGTNSQSCKDLFGLAGQVFGAGNVFPVDHYFAKPSVINLIKMRAEDALFRANYSASMIQKIEIILDEDYTLEDRLATYNSMRGGPFSDMFASHAMLALILPLAQSHRTLMGASSREESEAELIGLLENITISDALFGQYSRGIIQYSEGENKFVTDYASQGDDCRKTPTFFSCQVKFESGALEGVPISNLLKIL